MSSARQALLIFSKSADFGQVKTRLRSKFPDEACMALHLAFLQDTLSKTGGMNVDRFLYLAGSGHLPFDPKIPICPQEGPDLGARLKNAFEFHFRSYDRIVVIGTDSPTLKRKWIEDSFGFLENCTAVIGPVEDGGYYLIGFNTFVPTAFHDIDWGTSNVFAQTVSALHDLSFHILPTCFDVDTPQEIERLCNEIHTVDFADRTRDWVATHLRHNRKQSGQGGR